MPKQAKAKRDGVVNPQNYNFNQFNTEDLQHIDQHEMQEIAENKRDARIPSRKKKTEKNELRYHPIDIKSDLLIINDVENNGSFNLNISFALNVYLIISSNTSKIDHQHRILCVHWRYQHLYMPEY